MPTVTVHGETVGGGILKANEGRGAYLTGEVEGDSLVPGLWYGADGRISDGALIDPERVGEGTPVGGVSAASNILQGLLPTDGK